MMMMKWMRWMTWMMIFCVLPCRAAPAHVPPSPRTLEVLRTAAEAKPKAEAMAEEERAKTVLVTQNYVDRAIERNVTCLDNKIPSDALTKSDVQQSFAENGVYGEKDVLSPNALKNKFAAKAHDHPGYVSNSSVKFRDDEDKLSSSWTIPTERQVNATVSEMTAGTYRAYTLGNGVYTLKANMTDRAVFVSVVVILDASTKEELSAAYRGIIDGSADCKLDEQHKVVLTGSDTAFMFEVRTISDNKSVDPVESFASVVM